MTFKGTFDAAIEVWHWFYLGNCPTEGEEKPWRRVECAAHRIRESEQLLRDTYPAAVRVKNAKRVRRAVREIVRLVQTKLETVPDERIAYALAYLEVVADTVLSEASEAAAAQPLH